MTRAARGTAAAGDGALLELDEVSVGYAGVEVVRGVTLSIGPNEGLALLGPSGSGKTSLLYAVAGFIEPMAGEIRIRGRRVAGRGPSLPPEARGVGVVFQHYALWPHLNALETVAYPLRRRGLSRTEAASVARDLLARLSILNLADRRPAQLSGGEQQRVGLARALARAPDVYLLDEPTAHLDTALKAALQEELAASRRQAGAAMLYATHDVGEALAVADRVAVIRAGALCQVGTPTEVYERPVDRWTAELTGPASIIHGELSDGDGTTARLRIGQQVIRVTCPVRGDEAGNAEALMVRPDWVRLGEGTLSGRVIGAWYRGTHTEYRIETDGGSLVLRQGGAPRLTVGATTRWDIDRVWPLPDAGTEGPSEPSTGTPPGGRRG